MIIVLGKMLGTYEYRHLCRMGIFIGLGQPKLDSSRRTAATINTKYIFMEAAYLIMSCFGGFVLLIFPGMERGR